MQNTMLATLAATVFISLSATASKAHVSLEQTEAPQGSYKAVLAIPHGCDGEPTIAVRVELPEGFISAKPMPKPGWTLEIEDGEYAKSYQHHGDTVDSGPVAVTWAGGRLEDSHYDEFTVRGTLSGVKEGDCLFFKTTQTCPEGKMEAWVEEPAPGQNPHALEYPAPFVTISGEAASHDHQGHGTGEATIGDLHITGEWARAMLPGQPSGGAYMTIHNNGDEPDTLVGVTSPAAGRVEVHTMEMQDDIMVMRPLEDGLEVPAGGSVALKPGGLHLMFTEVKTPFREGAEVPVTLEFEKAGKVDLNLPVRPASSGRGHDMHEH